VNIIVTLTCGLVKAVVTLRDSGAVYKCTDYYLLLLLLKMVPFDSLGTVSYAPSIVTMAVSLAISETFSVKEWPDLEMWVWGRSRSLKMAYWHLIDRI